MPDAEPLRSEWITLQDNYEQYEKGGLIIKLLAVVLCAAGFVLAPNILVIVFLLLVLWLQDGIFRTSQARLGARIVRIEQGLLAGEGVAFQLHSEWLASRPGTFGLLTEYACSALRPTVAFPHAALLALSALQFVLSGK